MAPKYYPPHQERELTALHSIHLDSTASRKEAEAQLRLSLRDEATIQFLLKNLYWKEVGSEKKLAWRFNLVSIENNAEAIGAAVPDASRYKNPVLFIRGEKSGYIMDQDLPEIKKYFPQALVLTIPNAGHWVHAENPKAFFDAALSFLNS